MQVGQGLQASQAPTAWGSSCHHPGQSIAVSTWVFPWHRARRFYAESEPPECDVLPCALQRLHASLITYQQPRDEQSLSIPRYKSAAVAAEAGVELERLSAARSAPEGAQSEFLAAAPSLAGGDAVTDGRNLSDAPK